MSEQDITVSDGSILCTFHLKFPVEHSYRKTVVFLGGWGAPISVSDAIVREAVKNFDVLIIESREKGSSRLNYATTADLNRLGKDLEEIVSFYAIPDSRLIIYAFSWGGLIAAHAISNGMVSPGFAIFVSPISRLSIPRLGGPLLACVPTTWLPILKPLARAWLRFVKCRDHEHATRSVGVLNQADLAKWRHVARPFLGKDFLSSYNAIDSKCVIAFPRGDGFHEPEEFERIAQELTNAPRLTLSNEDLAQGADIIFNAIGALSSED